MERFFEVYEVFFRRAGVKRSVLVNNKAEANRLRAKLKANRRKFLGMRPVVLQEVAEPVAVKSFSV